MWAAIVGLTEKFLLNGAARAAIYVGLTKTVIAVGIPLGLALGFNAILQGMLSFVSARIGDAQTSMQGLSLATQVVGMMAYIWVQIDLGNCLNIFLGACLVRMTIRCIPFIKML